MVFICCDLSDRPLLASADANKTIRGGESFRFSISWAGLGRDDLFGFDGCNMLFFITFVMMLRIKLIIPQGDDRYGLISKIGNREIGGYCQLSRWYFKTSSTELAFFTISLHNR